MPTRRRSDRLVTLQRRATGRDSFNAPSEAWATLATVSARKVDVSDGERLSNAQVGAVVTARFRIRWSPEVADLKASDRLLDGSVTYAISGVKDVEEEGRRKLEITAARQG